MALVLLDQNLSEFFIFDTYPSLIYEKLIDVTNLVYLHLIKQVSHLLSTLLFVSRPSIINVGTYNS